MKGSPTGGPFFVSVSAARVHPFTPEVSPMEWIIIFTAIMTVTISLLVTRRT